MYAALEQKGKHQNAQVQALVDAEARLRQLLGQFPEGSHHPARHPAGECPGLEPSRQSCPAMIQQVMDGMGGKVARDFRGSSK